MHTCKSKSSTKWWLTVLYQFLIHGSVFKTLDSGVIKLCLTWQHSSVLDQTKRMVCFQIFLNHSSGKNSIYILLHTVLYFLLLNSDQVLKKILCKNFLMELMNFELLPLFRNWFSELSGSQPLWYNLTFPVATIDVSHKLVCQSKVSKLCAYGYV